MNKLENKLAIVTGGAMGNGLGITKVFLKYGCSVIIFDYSDKIKEILGIDVGGATPDGKFSLEATRCVGACGLAPVMTINNEVYGKMDPSKVKEILEKYE